MPLQSQPVYDEFMAGLRVLIAPYAGKVEYGNLRSQASDWDTGEGPRITNVAIVYETPGGSTDQINVSFDHGCGLFSVLDDERAEYQTADPAEALACLRARVLVIPEKRLGHLRDEIKRQMDSGI